MSKYIWYRKNVGPKKYHRNTISLRGTIRNNGVHAPIVPSPLPFDPHSTHIKIMIMMSTYFVENTLLYTQIQVPPWRGYCHIWTIQVCAAVKGMVFKQLTPRQGIEIREFGSRIGYHFQETDQLVEDFRLDQGNRIGNGHSKI